MDSLGRILGNVLSRAQIMSIILLVMIPHFILAARNAVQPAGTAGSSGRQAKMMHHMDTWLWLVQVAIKIVIILVMAGSAHVINILSNLPISCG